MPYLGEICSLGAAVLWALAIVLFKRSGENVHPIALNTFKNALGALLYLPTIYIAGGTLFEPFTRSEYALLAASGVLGIAIGDTLLLQSLNMIGASASALVSTLYSPFMIGLSYLWLGERLTTVQLVGVILIVGAVLETTRVRNARRVDMRRRFIGIGLGVAALLAMAVGVVMIKPLLDRAPLLWSIEIRFLGGLVALFGYLAFTPNRGRILSTLLVRESRAATVSSAVIGGYLAMLFWLGGMKLTTVSAASALNQTNMIWVLVFAAWILREHITPGRVIAIGVAFVGATLVIFG